MPSGRQEVDAAVHPAVGDPPLPVDVELLPQVLLVLLVHVTHDGLPAEEEEEQEEKEE